MPFGAIVLLVLVLVLLVRLLTQRPPQYCPPYLGLTPEELEAAFQQKLAIAKARLRYEVREQFRREHPYRQSHSPWNNVDQTCEACGLTLADIYMNQVYCSGKKGEPGLTLAEIWLKAEEGND